MLPWNAEDLTFDEARFGGAARLFPLPDLVMFPHVMQPLHIFEPRYRDMLNDALDSDGLLAMSVLAPGWEADYEGRPDVLPHVCLGRVIAHQRLDNGRYNLMLLGMRRARIICELPPTRTFRVAEVALVDDVYSGDAANQSEIQSLLIDRFQKSLPGPKGEALENVTELLREDVPLGVLTDLMAFALPLSTAAKRQLLAERNVDRRAAILLKALGVNAPSPFAFAGFPPRFSRN